MNARDSARSEAGVGLYLGTYYAGSKSESIMMNLALFCTSFIYFFSLTLNRYDIWIVDP